MTCRQIIHIREHYKTGSERSIKNPISAVSVYDDIFTDDDTDWNIMVSNTNINYLVLKNSDKT